MHYHSLNREWLSICQSFQYLWLVHNSSVVHTESGTKTRIKIGGRAHCGAGSSGQQSITNLVGRRASCHANRQPRPLAVIGDTSVRKCKSYSLIHKRKRLRHQKKLLSHWPFPLETAVVNTVIQLSYSWLLLQEVVIRPDTSVLKAGDSIISPPIHLPSLATYPHLDSLVLFILTLA